MASPNYATHYVTSDGSVKDFHDMDEFVQIVKTLDKQVENITEEIKNIKEQSSHDESRITLLEETTSELTDTIGKDDGENDTNPNDIESRLASHKSSIEGLRLKCSSNESTINYVNSKVTTNTDNISNLTKQLSQLNGNITALMTEINIIKQNIEGINDAHNELEKTVDNKLDKTHSSTLSVPTFNSNTFDLTGFYSGIDNKDVPTYLNDIFKWISAMMAALAAKY